MHITSRITGRLPPPLVNDVIDSSLFPPMRPSLWFHRSDIADILNKWPKPSSTSPDFIPLVFLKNVSECIVSPLEHIFNLSYMNAEVPTRWKHALVTPVLKKSLASDPKNYRPISITSVLARIFEKTVKKNITEHLKEQDIISENQFGFLEGRSVETAMLTALNDWTSALEDKVRTDVVYFDFMKAFDKVPIPKLLLKMNMLGIHPMKERHRAVRKCPK